MVWTRNYPVVLGAGVAILLFSLVGGAAITGVMPRDIAIRNPLATPFLDTTASAAAAKNSDCHVCGIVASIRPLRVEGKGGNRTAYFVTVRMDDGSDRTVSLQKAPDFPLGTRVRLKAGGIERG